MGEVYRARDTRLGREVAVKVLPAGFAAEPEKVARFEREARSASALSHAHVVSVFDVGRSGESFYIVTEIVAGGNLRDLLDRGPVPLRRALDLSVQIASGLAEAHESGVVHRDLKPENILLTKTGDAKIADFGLAKLAETGSEMSQLPTSDGLKTSDGIVMGTVAYMSPEQAGGRTVDFRSDQFAFGSIVYEMLTGASAFRRSTAGETMAALMRDEPRPVRAINSSVPPQLGWILDRCLAKEPDARYASSRDLARELALVREHLSEMTGTLAERGTPGPAASRAGFGARVAGWVLAAALGAGIAAVLLRRGGAIVAAPSTVRFELAPPPGGEFGAAGEGTNLAVSPDGQRIAYLVDEAGGKRRVWLRAISEFESRPVEGTEGARSIFWSPDSESLGFFSGGKLKRIDLQGRTPVTICDVGPGIGFAGTWGADSNILFASVQGAAIYRVSAGGGQPEVERRADSSKGEFRVVWPRFLPGGKAYLYLSYRSKSREIERTLMMAEPRQTPRAILSLNSRAEYLNPGYLVFARDGTLLAQKFDTRGGKLSGSPISIAPTVRYFLSTAWAGFSVSPNGTLVYQTKLNVSRLAWFDREGRKVGDLGSPADYLDDLSISPDGSHVMSARARADLGTYDLWMFDLVRGTETRLTSDPESEFSGHWVPGGKSIIYSAARAAPPQMILRDLESGQEKLLLPDRRFQEADDVTSDGRTLAFVARSERGVFGAHLMTLTEPPRATPLLDSTFSVSSLRFSPDGRYIAFISDESGSREAYVAPIASISERSTISKGGALALRWGRGGEIFFLSTDGRLMAVPVRTSPVLEIGNASPLFRLSVPGGPRSSKGIARWANFDVSPDGRRILAVIPEIEGDKEPASVVVHWAPAVQK